MCQTQQFGMCGVKLLLEKSSTVRHRVVNQGSDIVSAIEMDWVKKTWVPVPKFKDLKALF